MNVAKYQVATHHASASFDLIEWREAERLGRAIVQAVNERDSIIAAEGLDPTFCLPAAAWRRDGENQVYPAYALLSRLDPADVRFLRVRAQGFSDYSLLYMDFCRGRSAMAPIDSDIDSRIPPDPTPPTIVLHWQLLVDQLPRRFWHERPHALGEAGWWVDGILLNWDTIVYQERMTLLYRSRILESLARIARAPRILEIGGGYGALAHTLSNVFPGCSYTICDIPESLLFSGLYLKLATKKTVELGMPSPGMISLLPNYRFAQLDGQRFDLVINTLSLSEMTEHQATTYATGIKRLIGSEGVFFEQNHDNRRVGLIHCKDMLASVFPSRRSVALTNVTMTRGEADVWANADAVLAS